MNGERLRRTMLSVPGNNPGMIADAHIYGSDSVMFDLEDSVTLEDMLESKEDRAFYQSYLIEKYKCPLISFTVVMPGPVKRNKMSEEIFSKGKAALEAALGGYNIIFKNERQKNTGLEAFYCVDLDAYELKKLTVAIEDECRVNRLFDFDVIDTCKKPISRSVLGLVGRKCLICGEPAHACARSRKHSVDELLKEIERVLSDEHHVSERAKNISENIKINTNNIFEMISELAEKALIDEVSATPKPGLVDSENSGAHSDMDINTFKKSAQALKPYFYRFAIYGYETAVLNESEIFPEARNIGMEAEKAMFGVTGGVNTHKGMIFSAGLICIAVGRLFALNKSIDIENICYTVAQISKGVCQTDYSIEKDESLMTNGEKLYRKYGIKGIRGEAESGFATIRTYSYPFMKNCFCKGMTVNEAMVRTLIYMMSVVEDTNIISRGGKDMAEYVKKRAEELYNEDFEEIKKFDSELIQKNLSPGGCADLLALTWFIYNLEKI